MEDPDGVAFSVALSHTSLGLVPVALAIGFGIAVYFVEQRWRASRRIPHLLLLIVIWIFLLTNVLLILAALFHFGCARLKARQVACLTNMKQLGVAAMQYAQDHNETLPPAENWESALKPYLKTPLQCPSVKLGTSYAMNQALSKKKLEALENPADVVLFFESDNGTTVAQKRHGASPHFTFADGHAKHVSANNQKKLVWNFEWTSPSRNIISQ